MEAMKRALEASPDIVRATAYHQAGHAIFAILEGRGTEEMGFEWRTVNGIPELCGGYHLPRRGKTSPVAAMAGIAAARIEFANKRPIHGEEVHGPQPGWYGSWSNDLDRATAENKARYQGASAPLLAREDIAGATAVLLRNWPPVKALAEAVMERGKLSGDEAERIAIDAMPAQDRNGIRSLLEQAGSTHATEGPEDQNEP